MPIEKTSYIERLVVEFDPSGKIVRTQVIEQLQYNEDGKITSTRSERLGEKSDYDTLLPGLGLADKRRHAEEISALTARISELQQQTGQRDAILADRNVQSIRRRDQVADMLQKYVDQRAQLDKNFLDQVNPIISNWKD